MAKQIGYYVSVKNNGDYRLVSGPYRTQDKAQQNVDTISNYIVDKYVDGIWYEYGVARVEAEELISGCLDEQLHFDGVFID